MIPRISKCPRAGDSTLTPRRNTRNSTLRWAVWASATDFGRQLNGGFWMNFLSWNIISKSPFIFMSESTFPFLSTTLKGRSLTIGLMPEFDRSRTWATLKAYPPGVRQWLWNYSKNIIMIYELYESKYDMHIELYWDILHYNTLDIRRLNVLNIGWLAFKKLMWEHIAQTMTMNGFQERIEQLRQSVLGNLGGEGQMWRSKRIDVIEATQCCSPNMIAMIIVWVFKS